MPGKGVEFLDAGFHVMAGDCLTCGDRAQINLVNNGFVIGDRTIGDGDAKLGLGSQHRHPQVTLQHDLVFGGPQLRHRRAGVTGGEDVGDDRVTHKARFWQALGVAWFSVNARESLRAHQLPRVRCRFAVARRGAR